MQKNKGRRFDDAIRERLVEFEFEITHYALGYDEQLTKDAQEFKQQLLVILAKHHFIRSKGLDLVDVQRCRNVSDGVVCGGKLHRVHDTGCQGFDTKHPMRGGRLIIHCLKCERVFVAARGGLYG